MDINVLSLNRKGIELSPPRLPGTQRGKRDWGLGGGVSTPAADSTCIWKGGEMSTFLMSPGISEFKLENCGQKCKSKCGPLTYPPPSVTGYRFFQLTLALIRSHKQTKREGLFGCLIKSDTFSAWFFSYFYDQKFEEKAWDFSLPQMLPGGRTPNSSHSGSYHGRAFGKMFLFSEA